MIEAIDRKAMMERANAISDARAAVASDDAYKKYLNELRGHHVG